MTAPIRVVLADDSPTVRRILRAALPPSSGFDVVGEASDGEETVALVARLRPDVVTLDLEMPRVGGLAALAEIMRSTPTPVLVVSGVSREAAAETFRALELGAIDFVLKYTPGVDVDPASLAREIAAKVTAASRVRVIRSLARSRAAEIAPNRLAATVVPIRSAPPLADTFGPPFVVVVGASTGGPVALRELLGAVPRAFPGALLLVQHLPASFTGILAAQLDRSLPFEVKEAEAGDRLKAGAALVAPGGAHLLVRWDRRVELVAGPPVAGHRPSIDVTMQSAAQVFGERTRGVLLTGMGSDGVRGLHAIRGRGGRTYAQDAASCVVPGMPLRAMEEGVVDHVASPAELGALLAVEGAAYASRREAS